MHHTWKTDETAHMSLQIVSVFFVPSLTILATFLRVGRLDSYPILYVASLRRALGPIEE